MSRSFIPANTAVVASAAPQVLFETGSFVRWNKTGGTVYVVLKSQAPNMHEIRTLPSGDGCFRTYGADGENLTLVQTGNVWAESALTDNEKAVLQCDKGEAVGLFVHLCKANLGLLDHDLYRLMVYRGIGKAETNELIRAYNKLHLDAPVAERK